MRRAINSEPIDEPDVISIDEFRRRRELREWEGKRIGEIDTRRIRIDEPAPFDWGRWIIAIAPYLLGAVGLIVFALYLVAVRRHG